MCEIPCTSRLAHANMDDKKDGSKSDPELLAKVSDACIEKARKGIANWERKIAERKRRRLLRKTQSYDSSDDEYPKQSSRSNAPIDMNILPGRSGAGFQNPLFTVSHPPLDTTIADTSESLTDLQQSFQVLHETDCLLQIQPNSISNPDASHVFCNLLYTTDNNESKEPSCEQRIFQPILPVDGDIEDQQILRDIRDVFVSEGLLNDTSSEAKTLNEQQTVDKDAFQKPPDQDNRDCYDWDKFLDRWEGMNIVSESILKEQHHEQKTIEEPKDPLPSKRKENSGSTSQSVPFNGQAKKRARIADNPETSTSFKSISSDREHSSNPQFVLPSSEQEMDMIVHPVLLDTSDTCTASNLEIFIEKKLLENEEMPPLTKKFVSLLQDRPNRTNGTTYGGILRVGSTNLFKNQIHVDGNLTAGTNVSPDKFKELTSAESDDGSDTEMVS